MKLRDKHCISDFFLYYPNLHQAYYPPDYNNLLSPGQARKYVDRPLYLMQYVHFLADLFTLDGNRPEIYVYVIIC